MSEYNLKKNFALTIIILCGVLILYMSLNFLKPIVGALLLAFLTYPSYNYFYKKTKSKNLSAAIIIILILLTFIIPFSVIGSLIINEVNNFSIDNSKMIALENKIINLTGNKVSFSNGLIYLEKKIKEQFKSLFSNALIITSNLLLSTFILFFILFYLLVDKRLFLDYFIEILPFSKKNSIYLISEGEKVTKAILIGQVITAIVQGSLGMFSFFIAGINNAFLWGIIMIILSIIPVLGAFLVWVPAGIYLIINSHLGMGIFVLLWGFLVVSQIDNIIRPKLVGKFADIHPFETFFGILLGLSFFGIIGLIIGPLIISLFGTLIKVYKKEYLKNED